MSERVKLADATLASGPASGDNIIMERNGAIMRVSEVASAAQATADGNGNDIASTYAVRKTGGAYGWSANGLAWAKVASRKFSAAGDISQPFYATFHVHCGQTDERSGLLSVKVMTSDGGAIRSGSAVWETAGGALPSPAACLAWDPDASPGTVELWLAVPSGYTTTNVALLHAHRYTCVDDSDNWTLYTGRVYGGETVTDGLTVVDATVGTLQNGVATTSLSGIQSLSAGGGTIADTDLLLVKTESGLTGVTLAELKELLKD